MNSIIIKEQIYSLGAEVCGIADIDRFKNAPKGFNPSDIYPAAKSVIIFGKRFLKGVYESITNVPYTFVRNKLVERLDDISIHLSFLIEENGYKAIPIPSAEPYEYWDSNMKHGRGILSLKHAGELAGIGSIGKNTLLINEKYGNQLWLGGVITDAVLEQDPLSIKLCPDNCRICIEACPQFALNGITIDQMKCRKISASSIEGGGWILSCNICRKVCPFSYK
ncbi:MAG: epoxyqueuosine reductase [Ignavibacteriae bacterium HGW-Ignavibacteriae-4]|nr:MAG: epoxyqueuosine reductase [Ignavibacteriae bacterium HGW-Ignavibacteriae-4]